SGAGGGPRKRSGSRGNVADAPPAQPLVLASTSPQRRAILEQLGIPFDVVSARFDEEDAERGDAVELVRRRAREKARSAGAEAGERPVLGGDTAVVLGGRIYAQPANAADAEGLLGAP